MIEARNRALRVITRDALHALDQANDPPVVFARGSGLVRVRADAVGRHTIDPVNDATLRHRLSRVAEWRVWDARSRQWRDVPPPREVVDDVLVADDWPFPALTAVVDLPVLRPDGTVLNQSGYDPATSLYYAPAPGLAIPPIADAPTADDLTRARTTLDEAFGDFPFEDEASRSNTIGLLLSPIVRPVTGPVPLALIDKPAPGTGASLLAEVVALITTGRTPGITAVPRDDEELQKRITAWLRSGETFVILDNVDRRLDYSALALVLTASVWHGRILGRSEPACYPNRATWIATGNNLSIGRDIARRSFWIRLDAKTHQPWRRGQGTFRHPDLLS